MSALEQQFSAAAYRRAGSAEERRRRGGPADRTFARTISLALAFVVLAAIPVAADVIVARKTRHLSFTASMTPDAVRSGGKLLLVVNVVPNKRMNVYAPGNKYKAMTVKLNRHAALKPSQIVYPKPSIYIFKPLKEQVLVYSSPFKLTMNIAVGTLPSLKAPLKINGTLTYQACDDRVCYLPEVVPLEWTIPVRR